MLLDEHLNEKPGVSDKLKNKIIDVANDMGYVPNVMAREIMWQGTRHQTKAANTCIHAGYGIFVFGTWYLNIGSYIYNTCRLNITPNPI